MREAAERRQQLELEHEQALAVLNAKQQEIDLLQKVRGTQQHSQQPEVWGRMRLCRGVKELFVVRAQSNKGESRLKDCIIKSTGKERISL